MRNEELEKLNRRFGKKLPVFLEALARGKQFRNALDTPLGSWILTDITNELQNCIEQVISEKDNEEIRAEIRVLRKIINKWSEKINEFQKKQGEFNQVTGENK